MKKGFTLIELLVVITIMAILIGFAAVNYQKTVQLGRDSKRKSDIEQIRQALETYRSERGYYPSTSGGGLNTLVPTYINTLPTDPKSGSYVYVPASGASPLTYALCAYLEITPTSPAPTGCSVSCVAGTCNYGKTNP